jgi:Na+-transporting methylmalonyl-CoA/oxaloacetate decarboxylase gamma subunit
MKMSFQNVLDADGIGIAITGMSIVFCGLVLISLFIAALPKLLGKVEKEVARKRAAKVAAKSSAKPKVAISPSELSDEMRAAIGYVIHMEREFEDAEDHQRITVQRGDTNQVWAVTGRLRNLSTRL